MGQITCVFPICYSQVHISGVGDFQLCKIDLLKDPFPLNARKEHEAMDADFVNEVGIISYYYS